MKYKVITDQFKNIRLNEIIDYNDLTPLQQKLCDQNYE